MGKLKVGVLISGRGSNLQALIAAAQQTDYPAEIALVISNKADAAGLEKAAAAGIATEIIGHRAFTDRRAFDAALDATLARAEVGLVCLAGFMRILTPWFAERWSGRLINIHPSLLPSFKGLDAQAQAIEAGVRFSGCTVHFVTPEMDSGPIIVQAAVPVLAGDDAAALADRILGAEHRCYPLAVRLIAEGRVGISGGRVLVRDAAGPPGLAINPEG